MKADDEEFIGHHHIENTSAGRRRRFLVIVDIKVQVRPLQRHHVVPASIGSAAKASPPWLGVNPSRMILLSSMLASSKLPSLKRQIAGRISPFIEADIYFLTDFCHSITLAWLICRFIFRPIAYAARKSGVELFRVQAAAKSPMSAGEP
jgi:hypothetical protein